METEPRGWSLSRRKLLVGLGYAAATGVGVAGLGRAHPSPLAAVDGKSPLVQPPPLRGATPEPQPGHQFDTVIAGGRVIDPGSGFDGLANVGIDGATISVVSLAPLQGKKVLDATNRVVSPGFVDLLSYEPNEFGVWLKAADGVTTNLAMHGVSNYADRFFDNYEGKSPIHFGGAFHQHFMRSHDLGLGVEDTADKEQLLALARLAKSSLDDGFGGISFSLEYAPGSGMAEVSRLAKVAAQQGHVGFFHLRYSDPNPPGTSLEAIEEAVEVSRQTGMPLHIEHLTSTGGTFVMEQAIAAINEARAEGLDITACLYPYDFWGTYLGSARFSAGWQQRYRADYEDLQIAGGSTTLTKSTFADGVKRNHLVAVRASIPESEIQMALKEEWVFVASDGIIQPELNNHPRGAGTFCRTLSRYVRKLGVLDLPTALAKLSYLPAKRVEKMLPAMAKKGRLRRGADADVVVFDPVSVSDRATVAEPGWPSVGIDWVLVNGQPIIDQGNPVKTSLGGQAIKSAGSGATVG